MVGVRDALRGRAVNVVVYGSPEAPIVGEDRGEGGRGGFVADKRITDGVRTSATTERGMCCDGNDYERLLYIQQQDDAHDSITFIKMHIMCLILCYSPCTAEATRGHTIPWNIDMIFMD